MGLKKGHGEVWSEQARGRVLQAALRGIWQLLEDENSKQILKDAQESF